MALVVDNFFSKKKNTMTKLINFESHLNEQLHLMDVLAELMRKTNINIHQLSKNTGLSNTTIKRMCTDPSSNPTVTSIEKIATFFGITSSQLLGKEPLRLEEAEYTPDLAKWLSIPILTLEQAIEWPLNKEVIQNNLTTSFVRTDLDIDNDLFAIVAKDESLEPRFSSETILIFDPTRSPRNKDYVLVLLENKDLPQVRQVLIDGPDWYLKPINPNFFQGAPLAVDKNKCKLLGLLVQAKSTFIE